MKINKIGISSSIVLLLTVSLFIFRMSKNRENENVSPVAGNIKKVIGTADNAGSAMANANNNGVDPNLSARKELYASKKYQEKFIEIRNMQKIGKISWEEASDLMVKTKKAHEIAINEMRSSLYKKDYNPVW